MPVTGFLDKLRHLEDLNLSKEVTLHYIGNTK